MYEQIKIKRENKLRVIDVLRHTLPTMPVIIYCNGNVTGHNQELLRVPYINMKGNCMVPLHLLSEEVEMISIHAEGKEIWLKISINY